MINKKKKENLKIRRQPSIFNNYGRFLNHPICIRKDISLKFDISFYKEKGYDGGQYQRRSTSQYQDSHMHLY